MASHYVSLATCLIILQLVTPFQAGLPPTLEVVVTWKELTTSGANISIQIAKNASAVVAYQLEFESNSSAASLFVNVRDLGIRDPSVECNYKLLEAEITFVGYVVYWENTTYRVFPHNQSSWITRSYQYEVGSTWAIAYEDQYRFNFGGLLAEMQAIYYSENQSIPVNRASLPIDGWAMITIQTSCAVRNIGDSYFADVQALSSPGSSEIVLSLPNASAVSSFSSNAVRLRPNAFWVRVRADDYERFYVQYDLPSPEPWYLQFPYKDIGVGLFLIGVGALLSKTWGWIFSYRQRSRKKPHMTT